MCRAKLGTLDIVFLFFHMHHLNELAIVHFPFFSKIGNRPMNRLSLARRTKIINCLVEGNSIRSTERMTDTRRDTVTRLMVEVGNGCTNLADELMQDLTCQRLQCDEIWTFVKVKQAHSGCGALRPLQSCAAA